MQQQEVHEVMLVLAEFKHTFDRFLDLAERLTAAGERAMDRLEHEQYQQEANKRLRQTVPSVSMPPPPPPSQEQPQRQPEDTINQSVATTSQEEQRIQVVLIDSEQHHLKFRIKPTTKLQSLFTAYAKRKNVVDLERYSFSLPNGQVLVAMHTSVDCLLKDGDIIHVTAGEVPPTPDAAATTATTTTANEMNFNL
ncbi:hypothetical protein BASA81_007896 [Batrachochytrium salamandrivorans]|nr:hypothetical protein BASA81_007896 [Batrachochytrium salamandrivorans]